jgi:hypothetical protein
MTIIRTDKNWVQIDVPTSSCEPAPLTPVQLEDQTTYGKFKSRRPWLLRWEGFKLAVSEWWRGWK